MLDDDHLYATRDVEFAFRVWKVFWAAIQNQININFVLSHPLNHSSLPSISNIVIK